MQVELLNIKLMHILHHIQLRKIEKFVSEQR